MRGPATAAPGVPVVVPTRRGNADGNAPARSVRSPVVQSRRARNVPFRSADGLLALTRSPTLGRRGCQSVKQPRYSGPANTAQTCLLHCKKVFDLLCSAIYILRCRPARVGAPTRSRAPLRRRAARGSTMLKIDEFQKFGSEGVDVVLKQFGAVSKSVQAIASEVADYSKEAFETTAAATEKLL